MLRFRFNHFPAYRRCGARITYVSPELLDVKIELPLRWNNKSHIGSIWGGSLYSSIDPVYTIMLTQTLGKKYVVLDKAAKIEFLKPANQKLYAHFNINQSDIENIKSECSEHGKTERIYHVELKDDSNIIYLSAEKTIHIRTRYRAHKH